MASNTAVSEPAPTRRRWALSLEKASAIGFKSEEYGDRLRIQQPYVPRAAAACLFRWVMSLSRMTAVPGAISGIKTSLT